MTLAIQQSGRDRVRVAFLTEGTYPYAGGGVSSWSDLLLSGLPHVEFHILAATSQPDNKPRYSLPDNAASLTQIPLWGMSSVDAVRPLWKPHRVLGQRLRTTDAAIKQGFIPAFRVWLGCVFGAIEQIDLAACAGAVVAMAGFLRTHDYDATFRSSHVWQTYHDVVNEKYSSPANAPDSPPQPLMSDLVSTLNWLAALLRPLAVIPPAVDLTHATVSATVGLIGVVAKIEEGIPLLLTEHGVYLRERAIGASVSERMSYLQKDFLVRLADITTRLCYAHADLIAPVCSFNAKWEKYLGADPARIRVIYNAVDTGRFFPQPRPPQLDGSQLVLSFANVVPIKDIQTLIRAAALVRAAAPEARFIVYGSLTMDPDYVSSCQELIRSLGLEKWFTLAGSHPHPEELYLQGSMTVLSSISEAFPFTVLESMACARPVVATDVGGIAEAVGDAGCLTPPRSPDDLAAAIITLLHDPAHGAQLGQRGRERVLQNFQVQHLLESYDQVYTKLLKKTSSLQGSQPSTVVWDGETSLLV